MKSKIGALVALLVCLSLCASAAHATVLRVVVVQTENAEVYVKELERGKALLKNMGSPAVLRVWRARLAGSEAGQVVVSLEYPDLLAYAEDDKRMSSSEEFRAWLKALDRVRTIVSDSLYDELKP